MAQNGLSGEPFKGNPSTRKGGKPRRLRSLVDRKVHHPGLGWGQGEESYSTRGGLVWLKRKQVKTRVLQRYVQRFPKAFGPDTVSFYKGPWASRKETQFRSGTRTSLPWKQERSTDFTRLKISRKRSSDGHPKEGASIMTTLSRIRHTGLDRPKSILGGRRRGIRRRRPSEANFPGALTI